MEPMYIRRLDALNMKISFRTARSMAEETALIDSGATDNFIDEDTWGKLGIGKMELPKPITVHNVDGTENKQGKLTHYCWLRIVQGERTKLQRFYIMLLGRDRIILGYPFLYEFNPSIDWRQGRICGEPMLLLLRLTAYYAQQRVLCVARTRVLKAVDEDKEIGNNRQQVEDKD